MNDFYLDFVGVGPQRTGTSWLHQMLLCHPRICFPKDVKETMFFDQRYNKGLGWYKTHFGHWQDGQLRGEIGPTYFDDIPAPNRIYDLNSECKVIINLRSPVDRAWSSYRHHIAKGRVEPSFQQATEKIPQIIEAGHYGQHIPRWLDKFGPDQVTFILQEDIGSRPGKVLASIFRFLNIEIVDASQISNIRFSTVNGIPRYRWMARLASSSATWLRAHRLHRINDFGKKLGLPNIYGGSQQTIAPLKPTERDWLLSIYEPDIAFVETILERDLSTWRNS